VPDAPVARGGHTVQDGHTVQLPGADRTALLEAAVPTADAVRDGTVLLRTGAAAHEPEAGTQLLSAQRRSRRGGVFAGIAVLAAATLAGGLYVLHSEDSTAGGAPAAVVRTGPTPPVDLPLPAPPPEIETALPAPPAPSRPIPQRVVASAATPPPAAAAGRLRVTAYPPGNVFLDGVPLKKRTPLIDHAVPVGVHTLRVVADDGRVAEEQIDVSSSQTTTIAVRYP
jgi:hypothetical protein